MFGSNPFGQSSSNPFGSQQPIFGQTTNNAISNPFTPKPFGSTSPFGSQTGGSIFGGTSTGASSSPAFGSSTPAFGASSGSAFGNSSSAFGGSSVFGQKPSFGGFGSTTSQTSPFGASFQQSQPTFGNNVFGSSSPFGTLNQPAFGAQTTPAFGSSSPAFGSTTSTTFGGTSGGFGASSSPFGSNTPAFGATTTPAFGAAIAPAFGATTTPAFGATTTPAFGATTTPAFGATTTPAFGASASGFGASSTPSFNFGSSPAFGQATSTFGTNQFGAPAFGTQPSSFGAQTVTSTFGSPGLGQSTFGVQRGGSRVSPYSPTPETDGASGTQPTGKLESISAMPVYKDKSHEELRWEDYQLGDKGGPTPASQATSVSGFGNTSFGSTTSAFGQTPTNPFSSSTSSNPFAPKSPAFSNSGFGQSPASPFSSSAFGPSTTTNIFGSTPSATPSLFGSTQSFGANTSPSLFSSSSTPGFGPPSIFGPSSVQGTTSAFGTSFGFGNTQSSPLFQSTTPTLSQPITFGQTSSAFGQTGPGLFSAPSTGFANNLFSSTSSLISSNNTLGFNQTPPSLAMPFQPAQPAMSSGGFNFSNFGQSQSAPTNSFGGTTGIFNNGAFGQSSANQSSIIAQATPIANPFGTLPTMPQMSIGRAGTSPSIQYGISSLPVVEKTAPVKISSLLTSRHLSRRCLRLPIRKYNPSIDGPRVAYFNDYEETPSKPKADALFVPRENPRALVIRPLEPWHFRSRTDKINGARTLVHENGEVPQNAYNSTNGLQTQDKDGGGEGKGSPKSNGTHEEAEKVESYITLSGHRAGEAAIAFEHGADVEALMPKLRHSDYFTEPRVQELAAKERAEPGFCRHVRDFVVGRNGYGSIKFFGETDVRRLDLESLVQFNNREVIVYMDESKKPAVGEGLNKPAEVTLLNIKCFDKKTGQQFTEGPRIERYRDMLRRKAEDQGANFVSYDAVKGEWKFKVDHFSRYNLGDENENDDEIINLP